LIGAAAAGLSLLASLLVGEDCRRCPPPPTAPELEQARAGLAQAYAQANLCAPCEDSVLSKAAGAIAAGPGEGLPDPVALQRMVQAAGGGDPSPRAMLLTARDQKALARDVDLQWQPQGLDEVVGLGVFQSPWQSPWQGPRQGQQQGRDRVRLVVLSAERKVAVDPLPVRVSVGSEIRITGTLLAALHSPSVYVEGPNGIVAQIEAALTGSRFSARFEPNAPGSYAIEILGRGPRGPEVVFLKSVEVGTGGPPELPVKLEPAAQDDAVAVLDQINRERLKYGTPALSSDPRLASVAGAYAKELRELGMFGHVSPRSGDLKARLKRVGYPFRSAAENLAEGPTALEAQALAANSPAHRRAMLDPAYTRCGIGLSRTISGAGNSDVLLVEVFALEGP
jgi:uncharacterized protein YkwD